MYPVLLRNLSPGDEAYPDHEVFRDVKLMGFDFDVNAIIGSKFNDHFYDDNMDKITEKTFYTIFLQKMVH